MKSIEEIEERK